MGERAFALEKNWRFRAVEPTERADFANNQLPEKLGTHGWQPAVVPGSVHFDLMRTGEVPDPYVDAQERESYWVESQDFLFKTNFILPEDWEHSLGISDQQFQLSFESLETFASVWFNGHFLGRSQNQFLPAVFDVTNLARPGENVILVHFDSAVKRCTELEQQHGKLDAAYDRTRVYARRSPYLTGWSMAPRLSGCGIWGKVIMRRIEKVRLKNLFLPITGLSTSLARLSVEVEIESLAEQQVDIEMQIERLDPIGSGTNYDSQVVWEKRKSLDLRSGRFRYKEEAKIFEPALWWPLGFGTGRRTLYRATIVARSEGVIVDTQESIFGLRKIDLVSRTKEGTGTFYFMINGQPVFVRGASWVPPDMCPPRVPDEQVRHLLDLAANANINLLRVWGGGYYESETFYRRCDELGIMVWQDFIFAQGNYPEYTDLWKSYQKEAQHQVRRLRNHPSLVLWCGNDGVAMLQHEHPPEGEQKAPGAKIFSRLLPHVLDSYDKSRPYWPSTPYGGDDPNSPGEGDHREVHVWDKWADVNSYTHIHARFVSSFGFQGLPHEETVGSFTDARDKTLSHPDFDAHQKEVDGNARLFRYLLSRTRPPENFDELVYLSQWTQSQALALAIDNWRANKPHTMGVVIWHLNDCWPAISSSLIDYGGAPKLAYWVVRHSFKSTTLVLLPAEDGFRAVAIHDGPAWRGTQYMTCRLKSYALNGEQIDWTEKQVELPANGKSEIGLFTWESLGIQNPGQSVVVGELIAGRKICAAKMISPVLPKHAHYEEPKIECVLDCVVASRRAVLLMQSKNIVRGVEVRCEGLEHSAIKFENGFDLWPDRQVWIHIDIPPDMDRNELKKGLRFRCLNDTSAGRTVQWRRIIVQEPEESSPDAFANQIEPLQNSSDDTV